MLLQKLFHTVAGVSVLFWDNTQQGCCATGTSTDELYVKDITLVI